MGRQPGPPRARTLGIAARHPRELVYARSSTDCVGPVSPSCWRSARRPPRLERLTLCSRASTRSRNLLFILRRLTPVSAAVAGRWLDAEVRRPRPTARPSELGAGTGKPSSSRPAMWNSMASRISRSTSDRVSPTATHPGRSGTWAPRLSHPAPPRPYSASLAAPGPLQACLLQDRIQRARRHVQAGLSRLVTVPGLLGFLYWRWLPRAPASRHPSSSNSRTSSPTFFSPGVKAHRPPNDYLTGLVRTHERKGTGGASLGARGLRP